MGRGARLSELTDRIRDSVALSNLRECKTLLDALVDTKWDDEETQHFITRASAVCQNIISRLTIADKNLVPSDKLDELEDPTEGVLDFVQSLHDSAPSGSIDTIGANQRIDELLLVATSLPVVRIRTTNEVLQRAAEQFDREASAAKSSIATGVERLRTEAEAITERIQQAANEQSDLVDQLTESMNQQVQQAESNFGALEVRTKEAVEGLEEKLTELQDGFSKSQKEREAEFERAQAERGGRFREIVDPLVAEMESYKDQAREMLEEVAGASSAAHYTQQTGAQKAAADRWRRIGAGAFVVAVLAAIWIFADASMSSHEFSVVWLVARSGLLASILLFATYALNQAGHHRRREEEMASVSNELTLLWPFINRLPDEDRKALMLQITPLYFKGGVSAQDAGGASRQGTNLTDLIPGRGNRQRNT